MKDKYNLIHISTGDVFRYNIKNKTELGMLAKSYIDKGDLVPDEVTIDMLKAEVNSNPEAKGFIFDGFPRTLAQADALEALLNEFGEKLDSVIEMQVNDDVLVDRIVGRAEEARKAGQPVRADDNEESLKIRLMEYYKKTSPLIGYYYHAGDLKAVNGLGTIDEVAGEIAAVLG